MPLTHKKKSEVMEQPIVFKKTDHRRLMMKKSDVIAQNAIERSKNEKLQKAKMQIEKEVEVEAIQEEIDVLKVRMEESNDEVSKRDLQNTINDLEEKLKEAKVLNNKNPDDSEKDEEKPSLGSKEADNIQAQIDKLAEEYKSIKPPLNKAKKDRQSKIGEDIRVLEKQLEEISQ